MTGNASPRVVVVGAGIVGTSIALALRKRGADVTLVDRDEPGRGCSFGNSGAISPGSVAPLAMPGVLASVPGMMLDDESPLYLPLRYLPRALPWLLQFVASARPKAVEAGKIADLIVVGGNPLEDINNVRRLQLVLKDGRVVSDKRPKAR